MKLLLDTHTLIWIAIDPSKLSERVIDLFTAPNNEIFLSLVSVWEMQIKLQLGKLQLGLPLFELVESQRETNGLQLLPITLEHIYALENLPNHHRDPFDRLIVAQAKIEQMPILGVDDVFDLYGVERWW